MKIEWTSLFERTNILGKYKKERQAKWIHHHFVLNRLLAHDSELDQKPILPSVASAYMNIYGFFVKPQ